MFTTVSAQVSGVDYIPIAVQLAELAIIPTGTPCPLNNNSPPHARGRPCAVLWIWLLEVPHGVAHTAFALGASDIHCTRPLRLGNGPSEDT